MRVTNELDGEEYDLTRGRFRPRSAGADPGLAATISLSDFTTKRLAAERRGGLVSEGFNLHPRRADWPSSVAKYTRPGAPHHRKRKGRAGADERKRRGAVGPATY